MGENSSRFSANGRLPIREDIYLVNLWGTAPKFNYDKQDEFEPRYELTDMQSYGNDTGGGENEILQYYKTTLGNRGWTNITSHGQSLDEGGQTLVLEAQSPHRDLYVEIVPSKNISGYVASQTGSTITILSGITF